MKIIIALEDGDDIKIAALDKETFDIKFNQESFPNETMGEFVKRTMGDLKWHKLEEATTILKE
jgi:hypothetical protein